MTPAPARRVRALAIHAGYRCRHAGACCTSGWDIPVEPETEERLRAALRSGSLRPAEPDGIGPDDTDAPVGLAGESGPSDRCFRGVTGHPHGARAILRTNGAGECVFLDPRRARSGSCTVHRDLGETALPSACRHFPRVVTLTPLGVSVTLSHYCPTAAGLLFVIPSVDQRFAGRLEQRNVLSGGQILGILGMFLSRSSVTPGDEESAGPPASLRIVEDPPAFPAECPWEGLDARDALPPLLRPGVLMDWPSLERWERFAVAVLAAENRSPEAALEILATAAEDARRWTPAAGPFAPFFEAVLGMSLREPAPALSFRVWTSASLVALSKETGLVQNTPWEDAGKWTVSRLVLRARFRVWSPRLRDRRCGERRRVTSTPLHPV